MDKNDLKMFEDLRHKFIKTCKHSSLENFEEASFLYALLKEVGTHLLNQLFLEGQAGDPSGDIGAEVHRFKCQLDILDSLWEESFGSVMRELDKLSDQRFQKMLSSERALRTRSGVYMSKLQDGKSLTDAEIQDLKNVRSEYLKDFYNEYKSQDITPSIAQDYLYATQMYSMLCDQIPELNSDKVFE